MTLIQILNKSGLRRASTTLPIFTILAASIALFSVGHFYGLASWQGKRQPAPVMMRMPILRDAPVNVDLPAAPVRPSRWHYEQAFPSLHLTRPVTLTMPRDGSNRFYVFETRGRIVSFENTPDVNEVRVVLDLSSKLKQGRNVGPFGLAFHPEFGQPESPNRGYFYVFYKDHDAFEVLSRFVIPDGSAIADPQQETILIRQPSEKVHDGGPIAFGPDGFLYVATGDNQETENRQRIDRGLYSGVLRIDVDMIGGDVSHPPRRQPNQGQTGSYFIPKDNPFVGVPDALEEFYALGLRNPHRMSFDRLTNELWVGDVGAGTWEEVNLVTAGSNHQWDFMHGREDYKDRPDIVHGVSTDPIHVYQHSECNACVIGGVVYRGSQHPDLIGKYIFGDNGSNRIWALERTSDGSANRQLMFQMPFPRRAGVVSFGEDEAGEIYLVAIGKYNTQGTILKIVENHEPNTAFPERLSQTGLFQDTTSLVPQVWLVPYTVNVPLWSDGATKQRWIVLPGDGSSESSGGDRILCKTSYPYQWTFPAGTIFVKHFERGSKRSGQSDRLETRVLVFHGESISGVSYRWNKSQTDAFRVDERTKMTGEGRDRDKSTWTCPGPFDCKMCHNANAGFVLGVNERQLNCDFKDVETGRIRNVIAAWNKLGMLSVHDSGMKRLQNRERLYGPGLSGWHDESVAMETRVRSYLDVNCSPCHQPDGIAPQHFDLVFEIPIEYQGLFSTYRNSDGKQKSPPIQPGEPHKSPLWKRIASSDPALRMPSIGSHKIDEEASELIKRWIELMPHERRQEKN